MLEQNVRKLKLLFAHHLNTILYPTPDFLRLMQSVNQVFSI